MAAQSDAADSSDSRKLEALVPQLYQELRRLAAGFLRSERPDHTLQPTALVHEAYLRLAGQWQTEPHQRGAFLAIAARVMRQVLVDHARTRNRIKRGSGRPLVRLEQAGEVSGDFEVDLLLLDQALTVLEHLDPQQFQIVELRYFGGLSIQETAEALGISPATVKRDWRLAKAWLHRELTSKNCA